MLIFLQNKYFQNQKFEPGPSGWVDTEWPKSLLFDKHILTQSKHIDEITAGGFFWSFAYV